MMDTPAWKWLCNASWLITALVSINIGLGPLGFDFFKTPFVMTNLAGLLTPMYYLIGLAGVISLVGYVMDCSGCKY